MYKVIENKAKGTVNAFEVFGSATIHTQDVAEIKDATFVLEWLALQAQYSGKKAIRHDNTTFLVTNDAYHVSAILQIV